MIKDRFKIRLFWEVFPTERSMQHYKTILATFIVILSLLFATPSPKRSTPSPKKATPSPKRGSEDTFLSKAEIDQLGQLIAEGDYPSEISNLLAGRQINYSPTVSNHLIEMIEQDRHRSFEVLLPLVNFANGSEIDSYVVAMQLLLMKSFRLHRLEICNFLCSWDFIMITNYCYGDSFWLLPTMKWSVEELVDLVKHRPHVINFLTPQRKVLSDCEDVERGLMLLDFLQQCENINEAVFFRKHRLDPTKMLAHFVKHNISLDDKDMASIITHLIDLGANVNEEIIGETNYYHPSHVLSLRALNSALSQDA
jgi:hypothetical protein